MIPREVCDDRILAYSVYIFFKGKNLNTVGRVLALPAQFPGPLHLGGRGRKIRNSKYYQLYSELKVILGYMRFC